MARTVRTSGLRRLRAALLIAIACVVAGVAGLFLLGRASRPVIEAPVTPADGVAAGKPTGDEPAVLSEGFDYEQQVAGRPVFRLQGDRFTTDRSGKIALQGVRLVLYRDGEPYEVRSLRALYDPETQDAELDGEVRVSGGDGWEIAGGKLDLAGRGKTIVSRGGRVDFRRAGDLAGSARRMRYHIEEQTLELVGNVQVSGRQEPEGRDLALTAETLRWLRDGSTIAGEGGVSLAAGGDRVDAERIDARLRADGDGFESATASGKVVGHLRSEGGGRFEFTAAQASVEFDAVTSSPTSVLLAGASGGAGATLTLAAAAGGPLRRMTAPSVLIELAGGRPARAAASDRVVLTEEAPGLAPRSAEGDRLAAEFDARGELASARLTGGARLRDGDWTVDGDLAELLAGGRRALVTGQPAHAHGERGDLRSPRLQFDRDAARLDATGGVRASFRPAASPLAGADPGSAGQPADVEAREGTFFDAPRRFEFRGDVRAAQGESLLFADSLAGNEAESTATAVGKVRSQWTDRPAPGAGGAPVITVITAERLDYRRGAREARYTGGVKVRQERRELTGDDLLVELAEGGRARRLLLTGSVQIDDRVSGRSIAGASADYDLDAGSAIVTGEPVIIREQSGTTLRGRRALFDQRTGSARLVSDAP